MTLFALAIAAITGVNPFVGLIGKDTGKYVLGYALRASVIGLLMAAIYYIGTPALVGPFWGTTWFLGLGFAVNVTMSLASAARQGAFDSYNATSLHDVGVNWRVGFFPAVFILVVCFRGCAGTSIWTASERYAIVGEVKEGDTETLKPLSLEHIRVVAQEQASWKGDKVIADSGASLGSKFHPGIYNAQRVKDKLYWVSFLQYNAFRHWQSGEGGTPGFIMVSAEEIDRRGDLITESAEGTPLKLKYVESGYFGDNLERHIYLAGYQFHKILDIHREVDDNLKPHFVVTLGSPTEQYSVYQIDKVLLVDPQTGDITPHTVDEVPAWVDRVYPAELVAEYLEWWGAYHDGWWNSFWGKDEVVKPTHSNGKSLRLVWGADGQCYWFTGVTSVATSDQALVSFVLVNCRNGQVTEYRTSGIDESAALDAVNSAVSNYGNWHGSDCVLYHLYGEWTYIVPVLDDKGIFQRLAVVRLENGKVALGKTRQEAMREFQLLQTSSGGFNPQEGSELKRLTVKITRAYGDVQDGRTVYYVETAQTPGKVLTGTSQLSSFLPTTQAGDWAKVGILDSDQKEVPLQAFERVKAPEQE